MSNNEYDMLQNNIDRIISTESFDELFTMAKYAHWRIEELVRNKTKELFDEQTTIEYVAKHYDIDAILEYQNSTMEN